MRLLISLSVLIAACAGRTTALPPSTPPPTVAVPVPTTVVTLDEAAAKAKSHAFFEAIDRAEIAAFTQTVGPGFTLFQHARYLGADILTRGLESRRERHAPIRTRTWSDERVFANGSTVVFIGRAVVLMPAEAERPAVTEDGYNTLVWAHDGTRWQVAHWQWQKAGLDAERERWNEAYRQSVNFTKQPNQLLVDTIKGRKPGTALDLSMGQGRNAIHLASQGWKTTGVDISDEGIRIAKETAAKQKLKLEAIQADTNTWDFGVEKWDLVTLIYAGAQPAEVEKIKPSVRKGGLVVIEYFHKESPIAKSGAGGWDTGELAKLFTGWKIVKDETPEDVADWTLRKTKLVRFVAQKP